MLQNVNLLPLIPTRPKQRFSADVVLKASIAWIVLLIVVYGIGLASTKWQAQTLKSLEAKREELSKKVSAMKPQLSAVQTGAKNLEEINQELRDINKMINTLSSKTVESKTGFSNYFEALATYTPDDVWLSYIEFSRVDHSSLIKGDASTASAIPVFVTNLKKAPVFKGGRFDVLTVTKPVVKTSTKKTASQSTAEPVQASIPYVHFELSAQPIKQGGDA